MNWAQCFNGLMAYDLGARPAPEALHITATHTHVCEDGDAVYAKTIVLKALQGFNRPTKPRELRNQTQLSASTQNATLTRLCAAGMVVRSGRLGSYRYEIVSRPLHIACIPEA